MILKALLNPALFTSCPHTRGDDPGYFYPNFIGDLLVPIRVGMILKVLTLSDIAVTCPHTRGDDPKP